MVWFSTDTLSLKEIVYAMCVMFIKAPWSVKKGLMIMHGREFKMLLDNISKHIIKNENYINKWSQ